MAADLSLIVRETRMLIAHYRPQWDTRDFVREVATDVHRMRPARTRVASAMVRLRAEHSNPAEPGRD